jgi:SAM-dependent methyltransferase
MALDLEGNAPLVHLSLLAHHPERLMALRLAMSRLIGPRSTVLDAGCGALGTLAIMAAQLGARRVVGVDFGPLPMARRLAEENGVAHRVTFVESDLDDLDAVSGPFDVILAMVYTNDPRQDLERQRLVARLAARFAHPSTAFIPDRVCHSAAGYDSRAADPTEETRSAAWVETIERVEGTTGLAMRSARFLVDPEWRRPRLGRSVPPLSPDGRLAARFGYPDRNVMTQLTSREPLSETVYAASAAEPSYPPSLVLPVTHAGRLDSVVWRQDLLAGDLLIRSSETLQPVDCPNPVIAGEAVTLTFDARWKETVPTTIAPP